MTVSFQFIKDPVKFCVPEELLCHMRLTTSHNSVALFDTIIVCVCVCVCVYVCVCEKGLEITKIRFSSLYGTNSVSGEVGGLQAFIGKAAAFLLYINCRCRPTKSYGFAVRLKILTQISRSHGKGKILMVKLVF